MNRLVVVLVCLSLFGAAPIVRGVQMPLPMNPWVGNSLLFAPEATVTVGISAKSRYIAFNVDETLIATDAPPTIWDAKTLQPIAVADVYPRHSLGVCFRSNGDLIAGSLGAFAIYRRNGNRLELRHRVGPRKTTIVHDGVRNFDGIHYQSRSEKLFVPATDGLLEFDLAGKYPRAVSILSISESNFVTDDLSYSAERIRDKTANNRTGSGTVFVRRRVGGNAYEEIGRFRARHFCLAPNGRLITIDNKVYLIKGQNLSRIAKLDSVSKAAFTDTALQFAYVLRGPKIRVVRLHVGGVSTITEIDVGIAPTSLAFSPSGRQLATVDPHAGLRVYDYDQSTLQETAASRERAASQFPLKALRFLDSDRLLCQRGEIMWRENRQDTLVCIDTRTGDVVPTPVIDGKINPVGFNAAPTSYLPDPPPELEVLGNKRVEIDLENYNHPVACLIEDGVTKMTWPVADLRDAVISPDESRMAIGTYAGFVHIVDIKSIVDDPETTDESTAD